MMKRTNNYLASVAMMLLVAVFGSVGAWAQSNVVTVGKTTYGHSYLPSTPDVKVSTSQQIYTSSEIGKAGMITSIAFYNYDVGSKRNYDIYLSHTSKAAFGNESDWVVVAESNRVFSGTVNLGSGWTVIDFETPFQYDGKQNLLLTVDDNTGQSTGYNYNIGSYSASGHQALFYYSSTNLDPTQPITEAGVFHPSYSSDERKNCIQLCFETNPKPYKLEAVEVGDVSAQIQCSLRGDATVWNLRYRKVVKNGEAEQPWTVVNNLTDRSKNIEGLTPLTKYEAQVQAVFPGNKLSDWTASVVFVTNCCPVEEQADIIYAVNSNYSSWYGYAIQFVDITDENNPVEAAYINPVDYSFTGGKLTLCCGHKYKVNWIYDEEHSNVNGSFSLALYFEPGDLFFSMARGEAPEETAELTTFVMDCTPYGAQKPQNVSVASTTYNSVTITFVSETNTGEVVYSTEADFDPSTATPISVDFTALPASEDPWGGTPPNSSLTLTGLESLTNYYFSVRSTKSRIALTEHEPRKVSRWTVPIKVTTGSRYDAPTQVIAKPVNSRTEKLSWSSRGNEQSHNLYYRKQAKGNPVDPSDIQTFGGGKGTGFKSGSWGEGIQSSYGDHPFSNTLFVADVPAGSSFSFKAGNGKTAGGPVKFLYEMRKVEGPLTAEETMKQFDKKCLNDADRQARINDLNALLSQLELKIANGEITQEEYNQQKAAIEAEIASFNTLPTDAQKLEEMRTLEQNIKINEAALDALALKHANGEITENEYDEQKLDLEVWNTLYGLKLNELRAITTNAENSQKDGFSITRGNESANAPRRANESDTYVFFIRHSDPNGVLLVKDLTITPPEQQGEWNVIPNVPGNSYILTGLEPATTYEVMVEPVYDGGTTGSRSPITVFTTLAWHVDPVLADFSVSKGKKVNFAHGNLRYSGDSWGYEAEWSMAEQQYEILGDANISQSGSNTYPADPRDLFCWSTANNYCGVSSYYDSDDADAYFKAGFVDWGTDAKLLNDLGTGWCTLSKAEWNYLLNERENAASLKAHATVNTVKGIVILPDAWTAPAGVVVTEGGTYTAEQWSALEDAGAVFLPAAGQMTSTYDNNNWRTTTTVTEAASYWTCTESDDASGLKACTLTFTDTDITLDADMNRRSVIAVRLVKCTELSVTTDEGGLTTLVSTETLDFSDEKGLAAYIATSVDDTENTITLKRISVVPANTPVVLKGEPNTTYVIKTTATAATSPKENLLRGSATESIELEANTAYILADGKFQKNNAGTLPAGKAYLPADAVSASAQLLTIVFDDNGNTTAIKDVRGKTENVRSQEWYDLSGRKLNGMPTQKGIYIINGKKVVIK